MPKLGSIVVVRANAYLKLHKLDCSLQMESTWSLIFLRQ